MSQPETYRRTLAVTGGSVVIRIDTAPLVPARHRFARDRHGNPTMDGLPVRGSDSTPPPASTTLVTRFEVSWAGRRVPIADRQWKQLLNVPMTPAGRSDDDGGNLWALAAEDGRSVLLSLGGGDGAGGFRCWWVIRKDGAIGPFTEGVA